MPAAAGADAALAGARLMGLESVALAALGVAALFLLLALVRVEQLLRREPRAPGSPAPAVSVLVPVRGARAGLEDNLESLCRQDYPDFEVVVSVTDPDDAALPILEALRRRWASRFSFVVAAPSTGHNPKIANLHNALARARHPLLALVDSDVRWPPQLLGQLVAELHLPRVGLVTCFTRGVAAGGLPSRFEALALNTHFLPLVLLASCFESPTYAFGPTMLLRRTTLARIGGLRAVEDHLADDYALGRSVSACGQAVHVSGMLPDQVCGAATWTEVRHRLLRWWHIPRVYRPWGALVMGLFHGLLWALLYLVLAGGAARGWAVLGGWILWRAAACAWIYRRYLGLPWARELPWLVVSDALAAVLWLRAFAPLRFAWGGGCYTTARDGQVVSLATRGAPRSRVTDP